MRFCGGTVTNVGSKYGGRRSGLCLFFAVDVQTDVAFRLRCWELVSVSGDLKNRNQQLMMMIIIIIIITL